MHKLKRVTIEFHKHTKSKNQKPIDLNLELRVE